MFEGWSLEEDINVLNNEQLKRLNKIFHEIFEPVMKNHEEELRTVLRKIDDFDQSEKTEQYTINEDKFHNR